MSPLYSRLSFLLKLSVQLSNLCEKEFLLYGDLRGQEAAMTDWSMLDFKRVQKLCLYVESSSACTSALSTM